MLLLVLLFMTMYLTKDTIILYFLGEIRRLALPDPSPGQKLILGE